MALFNFAQGRGWSFQIEYNETTMRASALYCHNSTPYQIWGVVVMSDGSHWPAGGRTFASAGTFPEDIERINLPGNVDIVQKVSDNGPYPWPSGVEGYQVRVNV